MVFDRWSEVFVIRGKKMEHLKIIEKSIMAAQKSKDTFIVGGCIKKDFGSSIW